MKHIVLASASILALATVPAAAQTSPASATPPADEQGGLEEIVVTAQRVSESAQKAPLAIAVVKPAELITQNVTRAEDLSRVVPALVATASGGPNTSFFLRGVGNTTVNSYSDPAISFNYDGVFVGRPSATQGFFFDLQRVEVLKGPQGTLYGRNATGGAINVLPARPKIGDTSGELTAGYGNYDAIQLQGAVNVPIGEAGAFRLAGAWSKRDGYLSDGTADQDSLSLRAQVLAELTPELTTRIGVDYARQAGVGSGSYVYGTYAVPTGGTAYVFTPAPQLGATIGVHDPLTDAFVQTRFINQVGRNAEAVGSYPSQNNFVWGVTNETNWKTAAGTFTVQAAYREGDVDSLSTTSNFRAVIIDEHSQQASIEARFAGSFGDTVDYLIGAFLFDEDIDNSTVINQITSAPFQNYETGTNSKAVFGRVQLHVTDTLTLTAAGRFTDDLKYMAGVSNVYTLNCGNPNAPPQDLCPTFPLMPNVRTAAEVVAFYTGRGIPVGNATSTPPSVPPAVLNTPRVINTRIAINTTLSTEKFTYRLAADWDVTPSNLLYASFETGFHAGGFNFARGFETYNPEEIEAYTIGSKNRFFANRVQLNIEAFYWKYRDQQVSSFGMDLSTPPISAFITSNVSASTIKGVDVDFEFLATPTTRLGGSVQYLDTSYDSYVTFASTQGPLPNFDCPITVSGTLRRIDCSGKPGLFSPKWSFNVNAEQTFQLGNHKVVLQAGTRYRGDFFAATSYQPWVISPAGFQSNASVALTPDSNAWSLTAFVNNIEDERRMSQSNANPTLLIQSGLATAPRTYGVRIGAKF